MTNEERKQWIEACKELLVKYENGTHNSTDCPLCTIANDIAYSIDEDADIDEVDACEYCLWHKIMHTDCMHYAIEHTQRNPPITLMQRPDWIALRIKQLPDWIKQLEEAKCDD